MTTSDMNSSVSNVISFKDEFEKEIDATFYVAVVACSLMGLVSSLGNGLVMYISVMKNDQGRFRYVNMVVKNLALTDFLYGVIGVPMNILFWYWGKTFMIVNSNISTIYYIYLNNNLNFRN